MPSKWTQLLLVPILFYLGVKLSLAFAVLPEVLVMLWMPNSLLVATLFHYGMRRYGYFAAMIIAAEIAADYPTFSLVEAVCFGAINLVEATTAYLLLRLWRFDSRFARPIDLAKFVVAGPMIAAFIAASSAAAVYSYFRGTETSYFEFLRVWWFSDGLGLLILTPLVLGIWPPDPLPAHERAPLRWYDVLAIGLGAIVVAAFALSEEGFFRGIPIRSVLLLPMVLFVAARFSLRTTTLVLVIVAAVVLYVAKNGQDPFGPLPIHQTVLSVQEFIFTMSVMALGFHALLSQLRANTRELEARVQSRTAELSVANTRLRELAVTDSLTGLPNRRALFGLLRREIGRERRHGHGLAVVMFDVDHFKDVNDRYGHAAGDNVLRHVARVTSPVVRSMDTLARYGGEEFVLVAPETDEAEAVRLAERMLQALRSSEAQVNHHAIRVTASFGVAMLRPEDGEPEPLLRRADAALYAAKAGGRDQVCANLHE